MLYGVLFVFEKNVLCVQSCVLEETKRIQSSSTQWPGESRVAVLMTGTPWQVQHTSFDWLYKTFSLQNSADDEEKSSADKTNRSVLITHQLFPTYRWRANDQLSPNSFRLHFPSLYTLNTCTSYTQCKIAKKNPHTFGGSGPSKVSFLLHPREKMNLGSFFYGPLTPIEGPFFITKSQKSFYSNLLGFYFTLYDLFVALVKQVHMPTLGRNSCRLRTEAMECFRTIDFFFFRLWIPSNIGMIMEFSKYTNEFKYLKCAFKFCNTSRWQQIAWYFEKKFAPVYPVSQDCFCAQRIFSERNFRFLYV